MQLHRADLLFLSSALIDVTTSADIYKLGLYGEREKNDVQGEPLLRPP